MKCLYNEGKLLFKLSKSVTIIYNDKDLQVKVKRILKHIT